MNATAAFVDVGLATALVAMAAGEIAALLIPVMFLVMPAFVEAHLSVLSEPLFLACFVATLFSMYEATLARSERGRLGWSLAGGAGAALSVMVRYVGISACAASALWVLFLPGTFRARLRRAVVAIAPWLILTVAWVLRTRHAGGPSAIRSIGAYGGMGETLRQGVNTIVGWLVPLSPDDMLPGRLWIALVLAMLMLWTVARGTRAANRSTDYPGETLADAPAIRERGPLAIIGAASLFGVAYAAVLLASRLLADPRIPFDNRLLLPLFVLAILVVTISIRSWWRDARLLPRLVCGAVLAGWVLACYHVSSDDIDWVLENGYDLTAEPWRSSALITWARAHASGHPLYSNWPAAVVLHLGRPTHETPAAPDPTVLRQFAAVVHDRHGLVLAFETRAPDLIGVDALLRAPGLRRLAQLADGSVFSAIP